MNPLRELKPNQPGRVEPLGAQPPGRGFDGTVREVSEAAIVLELAQSAGDAFRVGQRVALQYWDVFGMHRGETEVTRVSGTRVHELELAPPASVELTQKRRFFRVEVSVPVLLRARDGRVLEAYTEDLTPAGLRATLQAPLEPGEEVTARLDFGRATGDATPPVETEARVVRAVRTADGFATSFAFPRITEAEQVRISLLLFALQRRVS